MVGAFQLDRVENHDEIYDHSRLDFEVINFLISRMKNCMVPSLHDFMFEPPTKMPRISIQVAVTGWKKWRINVKLVGYWEYLDSYSLGEGRNGFGRITFNAVESVEIPFTF
ncbi:hypothetical protein OROMI_015359 [Orobanche minor]